MGVVLKAGMFGARGTASHLGLRALQSSKLGAPQCEPPALREPLRTLRSTSTVVGVRTHPLPEDAALADQAPGAVSSTSSFEMRVSRISAGNEGFNS